MGDITNPTLLYGKGGLMLAVGCLASALVIARNPEVRTAALLAVAVWGFCRAYYFAFYVIEHYVDAGYKFAGLYSLVRHWARHRQRQSTAGHGSGERTDAGTRDEAVRRG